MIDLNIVKEMVTDFAEAVGLAFIFSIVLFAAVFGKNHIDD